MKLWKCSCPGNGFHRKSRSLCFVLLAGKMEWLGSDEFSGSSLQPCNSLLYKHQHIVFQRGSVFVKTPVCLGSLCLWGVADQEIWEVLAKRQPGVAPGCVSLLCDGSHRDPAAITCSPLPSGRRDPLWIIANYFSAPGKPLICKYSF